MLVDFHETVYRPYGYVSLLDPFLLLLHFEYLHLPALDAVTREFVCPRAFWSATDDIEIGRRNHLSKNYFPKPRQVFSTYRLGNRVDSPPPTMEYPTRVVGYFSAFDGNLGMDRSSHKTLSTFVG
jgi:hypothetical protein